MSNVLIVVGKLFTRIFAYTANSPLRRVINHIVNYPYLCIGAVLLIIGFSVGTIKRIIHC